MNYKGQFTTIKRLITVWIFFIQNNGPKRFLIHYKNRHWNRIHCFFLMTDFFFLQLLFNKKIYNAMNNHLMSLFRQRIVQNSHENTSPIIISNVTFVLFCKNNNTHKITREHRRTNCLYILPSFSVDVLPWHYSQSSFF